MEEVNPIEIKLDLERITTPKSINEENLILKKFKIRNKVKNKTFFDSEPFIKSMTQLKSKDCKTSMTNFFNNKELKRKSIKYFLRRNTSELAKQPERIIPFENQPKLHHGHLFNHKLTTCNSVKIIPIGSKLERFTEGSVDMLKKFEYYTKIENTDTYKKYLNNERIFSNKKIKDFPVHSQRSMSSDKGYYIIDKLAKESTKELIDFNIKNKYTYGHLARNKVKLNASVLKGLEDNNKKKIIKNGFKKLDLFTSFIIEKYREKFIKPIVSKNHRTIFVILDGVVVFNINDIKGFYLDINKIKFIKKICEEQINTLLVKFLRDLEKLFNLKKSLKSIFTPNKELITDLLEIKPEYNFIYISQSIICKGIILVSTPTFINLYETQFKSYLQSIIPMQKLSITNLENYVKKELKIRIKNKVSGINPRYEIYKPHYSYAEGEEEHEHNEYLYYSDEERRVNDVKENVKKHCLKKEDIFIYLSDVEKTNANDLLKNKIIFNKPFNLYESYMKFNIAHEKLVKRYKEEVYKKLKIPLKNRIKSGKITSDSFFSKMVVPTDKISLDLKKNNQEIETCNKYLTEQGFYNSLDKKLSSHISHFIFYNIPKLLEEFKNYSRQRLFDIFAHYKDLMAMSYSNYKSDFILENGIDFNTFWLCIDKFSNKKQNFVKGLFNRINSSPFCVMKMKDFFNGMYYIQNPDLTIKLDLFLKALDSSSKGQITFKEAISICKDAIQRNFKESNSPNSQYALNELSNFFAKFIFDKIGVKKGENLKISDLKNAIINNKEGIDQVDKKLLIMFSGANI